MHFRVISYGQGTEWGIGLLKFLNIFGVLEKSDIFGGER